jgi:hypothetical protein
MAEAMTKNYKEVEFYAVSCMQHKEICQKFSLEGYPTLMIFQRGDDSTGKIISRSAGGQYSETSIAKKLGLKGGEVGLEMGRRRASLADDEDKAEDDDDNAAEEENKTKIGKKGDGDDDDDKNVEEEGNNGKDSGEEDGLEVVKSVDDEEGENGKDSNEDDDKTVDEEKENGEYSDEDDEKAVDEQKENGEYSDEDDEKAFDEQKENGKDSDEDDDKAVVVEKESGKDSDEDDDKAVVEEEEDESEDDKDDDKSGGVIQRTGPSMGRPGMGRPAIRPRPGMGGRDQIPGAGAAKARVENKEMDRWREALKEKREEMENRRKGLGRLTRPTGGETMMKRKYPGTETARPETMTKAMKARTPGTQEYEMRKAKLMERLQKVNKGSGFKKTSSTVTKPVLKRGSLPFEKVVRKPGLIKKAVEKMPLVKRFVHMSEEEELILDVSLSFVSSLRYGVFINGKELTLEKKAALKDWLDLLSVSLPAEWGLHKLIDALRRSIDFVAKSDKNLAGVINAYPLPRRVYSQSCTKQRAGGGFSCGFWKLLHIVTIGIAEHKGGINLIEAELVEANTKTYAPIEAADAIRNYIANFFGCEICRENFVATYDDCGRNRRCDRLGSDEDTSSTADWKELAMWMWEVHNDVSVHISRERMQRMNTKYSVASLNKGASYSLTMRDEVKVLWPHVENCLICFGDDGTWDESEVFRMLEKTYW